MRGEALTLLEDTLFLADLSVTLSSFLCSLEDILRISPVHTGRTIVQSLARVV